MRQAGARLVHGPANALPLLTIGLPGVVTIHDLASMTPRMVPGASGLPRGSWCHSRLDGRGMIICPSDATKRATVRLFASNPIVAASSARLETEFALPAVALGQGRRQGPLRAAGSLPLQLGTVQPR